MVQKYHKYSLAKKIDLGRSEFPYVVYGIVTRKERKKLYPMKKERDNEFRPSAQ